METAGNHLRVHQLTEPRRAVVVLGRARKSPCGSGLTVA